MSDEKQEQIERAFTYHPPQPGQQERYQMIRAGAKSLAYTIAGCAPSSRERSLAMTALEQAVMWANAAISRNEAPTQKESI